MRTQGVAAVLTVLLFLSLVPAPAPAPIKAVSTHTIQAASITTPGETMSAAAHLTEYSHTQNVYQYSYERALQDSENVERVISDRFNRLEGVSQEMGEEYANRIVRQALQDSMSQLTDAAVSETVEAASVKTDQETIRVAVEQTSISDARGEVHLEFEGNRIFVATESEEGSKSYRGSVSARNGQFGDLDPEKFKGSTPIEALRTACDEITTEEWSRAKEQFSPVIQEEFGVRERIIDLTSKDVVCDRLESGGGNFDVPG